MNFIVKSLTSFYTNLPDLVTIRVATMQDRQSVSKVNHYCLIIRIQ